MATKVLTDGDIRKESFKPVSERRDQLRRGICFRISMFQHHLAVTHRLDLFGIGYSWGGFESLALPFDVDPVRSTMAWPKEGWGLEDRFAIRLSIGLEDKDDLIADLTNGFAAMNEG